MQINGGWSDNTPVNYTNYMPGTVKNALNFQQKIIVDPAGNCVIMEPCSSDSTVHTGQWWGSQCSTKYRQAICKKAASG